MESEDELLDEIEDDPDVKACKERLLALEGRIKQAVSDDAWELLLEWEAEWANYATLCAKRLAVRTKEQKRDQ